MKKNKLYFCLLGAITGAANGLFGSGGGIIAVPMLEKSGIEAKKSHATSLALTLPLSVISVIFYMTKDSFPVRDALVLAPLGVVGAAAGSLFLKKISCKWLKRIFGVFLIIAGGRMMMG